MANDPAKIRISDLTTVNALAADDLFFITHKENGIDPTLVSRSLKFETLSANIKQKLDSKYINSSEHFLTANALDGLSANWQSAFKTVSSQSADWAAARSADITTLSNDVKQLSSVISSLGSLALSSGVVISLSAYDELPEKSAKTIYFCYDDSDVGDIIVKFNPNGGYFDNIDDRRYNRFDKFGNLPVLRELKDQQAGFYGWCEGFNKVNGDSQITGNANLCARWLANVQTMMEPPDAGNAYIMNGPVAKTSDTFISEQTTAKLSAAVNSGYSFDHWNINDDTTQTNILAYYPINKNLTCNAICFPNAYTVSINRCQPEGFTVNPDHYDDFQVTFNTKYADNEEYKKLVEPSCDEHTFLGWKNLNGMITDDTIVSIPDNHEISAEWWRDSNCKITFEYGIQVDPVIEIVERGKTLSANKFPSKHLESNRGKYVHAWKNKQTSVEFDHNTLVTANVIVTADWQPLPLDVTFDLACDNGRLMPSDIPKHFDLKYGDKYDLSGSYAIRPDHKFDEWQIRGDGYVSAIIDGETLAQDRMAPYWFDRETMTGKMSIYAQWSHAFYVTFDANGGKFNDATSCSYYKIANAEGSATLSNTDFPNDPEREHYTFNSWHTERDDGDLVEPNYMIHHDFTCYAHWKPQTFNVTLDPGDGRIKSGDVKSYEYGTTTILPTDIEPPDEYTFIGWYTSNTGGSKVSKITDADYGDKSYYARYQSPLVTISTLKEPPDCPAEISKDQTVSKGSKVQLNAGLTSDWAFDNWTVATGKYDPSPHIDYNQTIMLTADYNLTATAYYLPLITVTFDGNGGYFGKTPPYGPTIEIQVAQGKQISAGSFPSTGYPSSTEGQHSIVGWTTDKQGSQPFDKNTEINSPITLYPVWSK